MTIQKFWEQKRIEPDFNDFEYWLGRYAKTKSEKFRRFIVSGLRACGFDDDYSPADEGMHYSDRP